MKWEDYRGVCPWRMVPLEDGYAERCAAITATGLGLGCSSGACAPFEVIKLISKHAYKEILPCEKQS